MDHQHDERHDANDEASILANLNVHNVDESRSSEDLLGRVQHAPPVLISEHEEFKLMELEVPQEPLSLLVQPVNELSIHHHPDEESKELDLDDLLASNLNDLCTIPPAHTVQELNPNQNRPENQQSDPKPEQEPMKAEVAAAAEPRTRQARICTKIRPPVRRQVQGDEREEACEDKTAGRRQNQLLRQIELCPTFEPTLREFTEMSFQDYLVECEKLIDPNCGVFKVRAPDGWQARQAPYNDYQTRIDAPIEQNVNGQNGYYQLEYIRKPSKMLQEFMVRQGTRSSCEGNDLEVETQYWKSLRNQAPIYGADQSSTLFDAGTPWNLSEIESILNDGMQRQHIPGVTQPYLYVGVWRSLFGWHKEDVDLYSINYLHYGKPKFWYSIDLDSNEDFEELANTYFKDLHRECREFLRHKTTLIEPKVLLANGIKLRKVVQREREFVISRAAAYHSGFNSGFNIAEAVNFALPNWIPIGQKAGYCKCVHDSVRIDMEVFMRRLNGEEITDEKLTMEQAQKLAALEVQSLIAKKQEKAVQNEKVRKEKVEARFKAKRSKDTTQANPGPVISRSKTIGRGRAQKKEVAILAVKKSQQKKPGVTQSQPVGAKRPRPLGRPRIVKPEKEKKRETKQRQKKIKLIFEITKVRQGGIEQSTLEEDVGASIMNEAPLTQQVESLLRMADHRGRDRALLDNPELLVLDRKLRSLTQLAGEDGDIDMPSEVEKHSQARRDLKSSSSKARGKTPKKPEASKANEKSKRGGKTTKSKAKVQNEQTPRNKSAKKETVAALSEESARGRKSANGARSPPKQQGKSRSKAAQGKQQNGKRITYSTPKSQLAKIHQQKTVQKKSQNSKRSLTSSKRQQPSLHQKKPVPVPVPILKSPLSHHRKRSSQSELDFFIGEIGQTQDQLNQEALEMINSDPYFNKDFPN